jgi:hypothetical protein
VSRFGIGGILASLAFAVVNPAYDDNLIDFAWRIPFWLGPVGADRSLRAHTESP